MKKILLAAVAVSSLAAALPAAAQYGYSDRSNRIERRIERGVQNGSLTWGEARRLRDQLNYVERLENRYQANGMTGWEARDLDRRYDALSSQLRYERNDTQYRYDRNDSQYRYDRNYRDWYGY